MDLIDRQEGIKAVNSLTYPSSLTDVKRVLVELPTIDAEPVRHGEWVIRKHAHMLGGYTEEKVHCSVCDWCAFKSSNLGARIILDEEFIYCPHCGAKMDEDIRMILMRTKKNDHT